MAGAATTDLMKTVNFGKGKSGILTVGYTLYTDAGEIQQDRSTTGIFELGTGTGIFGAKIRFPKSFTGTILWDTGEGDKTSYATEEYNGVEEDLAFVKAVTGGRWKLDPITNVMTFFGDDNLTPVACFTMYNSVNNPSVLEVHQRIRNDDLIDASILISGIDP